MTVEESRLRFEFSDEEWRALVKYDEEKDYKKLQQAIPETKGVDFLGMADDILFFIEVKNYRGFRIRSKPNIKELDLMVAQKVRDTIAGIVGGKRNSTHLEKDWEQHLLHLTDRQRNVHIILWLEEDAPNVRRHKVYRKTLLESLKKRLSWLSTRIIVVSKDENPLSDKLKVEYTPDQG